MGNSSGLPMCGRVWVSKRSPVEIGTLTILEMPVPLYSHQKHQPQWNGTGGDVEGRLCTICQGWGQRGGWFKSLGKTQRIANESQILTFELFALLELVFSLCRFWLCPVSSFLKLKKKYFIFYIAGTHRWEILNLFKKKFWIFTENLD